jgi:hypothetical protein
VEAFYEENVERSLRAFYASEYLDVAPHAARGLALRTS